MAISIPIWLVKHLKRLRVQVSIAFIAKDIAILRLSVTSDGHLQFSNERVDEKIGNSFYSVP